MVRRIDKAIKITGAAEHNLKNISLDIPRDKLVVITGISGSGKSSLAFDTIYAEGRRKYVESLSTYARQFLEQMQKPAISDITGLPLQTSFCPRGPAPLLGMRPGDYQPAFITDSEFDSIEARRYQAPDLRPAGSR
jgi:hypothetical protein